MITRTCTAYENSRPTNARQYTHVCIECAGIVVDTPKGVRCLSCGGTLYANVPDDEYREWIAEIKFAIALVNAPTELYPPELLAARRAEFVEQIHATGGKTTNEIAVSVAKYNAQNASPKNKVWAERRLKEELSK